MSAYILNPFDTSFCFFVCAMCVCMCLFCLTLKMGNLWPADNCQFFKGCPSPFIIEGKLLFFLSVISHTAAIEIHFRLNICHNLFRDPHFLGMMLVVWRYFIQASLCLTGNENEETWRTGDTDFHHINSSINCNWRLNPFYKVCCFVYIATTICWKNLPAFCASSL